MRIIKNSQLAFRLLGLGLLAFVHCGSGESAAFYCGDLKDDHTCAEYGDGWLPIKAQVLQTCLMDRSAVSGDGPCPRADAAATCTLVPKDSLCQGTCSSATSVFYKYSTFNLDATRKACEQAGGTFRAL